MVSNSLPTSFKLFVTSWDEHDICQSLQNIGQHIGLPTGELVEPKGSNDISLFFRFQFAEITMSYLALPDSWPGEATIEHLTECSAGLFIWAQTVMKFMLDGGPEDQLALILNGDDKQADINSLYITILEHSFHKVNHHVLDTFQIVFGAVILAKSPLCREDLKCLLGSAPEVTSVDFILNKLSSVISTGEIDRLLRISHQSFANFLTDPERCPKSFVINPKKQNLHLAQLCVCTMINGLSFNICQLETSYLFNDEVPDLSSRIQAAIPPQVAYLCRFWGQHLQGTSNINPEANILFVDIKFFLHNHILYWLEVLSLIREVSVAIPTLISVAQWIQVGFFHAI